MVHYKLTYFDTRGAAEPIRQTLVLAGQKFDDVRLNKEEWPQHKQEYPFGQLPVLEVDGKQLAQSYAINRYVAKQHGLAGKNAWEEAVVDSLGDQCKDFLNEILPFLMVAFKVKEGDLEALKKEKFVPATTSFCGHLTKFLKSSGTGYLVGSSATWVDILVAYFIDAFGEQASEVLKQYPEVVAHKNKIHSIPAIAKWIKERPVTDR